jgi:hypothetical protein
MRQDLPLRVSSSYDHMLTSISTAATGCTAHARRSALDEPNVIKETLVNQTFQALHCLLNRHVRVDARALEEVQPLRTVTGIDDCSALAQRPVADGHIRQAVAHRQ